MENNLPTQPVSPPTQSTQINQQSVNKQNRKKWIVLIPLVILLLTTSVSAYYLTYAKGKGCGGIAGETGENACPAGYVCRYADNYPDASGSCLSRLEALFTKAEKKPVSAISPYPSPTPDLYTEGTRSATANWKTYTNQQFGFTLKYPPEDTITSQQLYAMLPLPPFAASSSGISIGPPFQEPYSKWYSFDIVVRDNPQNVPETTLINNYITEVKKTCSPPGCSIPELIQSTLKEYKNGDINGYIFHIGAETDSLMVLQVKNNKAYIFRLSGDSGQLPDQGQTILEQILSTFKFTP